MDKILKQLNIKYLKIGTVSSGYRNKSYPIYLHDNSIINFIFFKEENGILERIVRANQVGDYLFQKGFPSRRTIDEIKIVEFKSQKTGVTRYGCFYEYLPGFTIPWESYSSKHIKSIGGKMGEMHRLLNNLDSKNVNFPFEIDIQRRNCCEMEKYFSNENVLKAMNLKLKLKPIFYFQRFKEVFTNLESEEKQILHMDFVRGNILFDNSKNITGVLDFEKVSFGPRIFDIARTLSFLLVDCKYVKPSKVWKYFLYNGYKKRGNNTLPNLKYIYILIKYFWIYDFYKFLKHNPYEFLKNNNHFIRTKNFLIELGLLKIT